MSNYQTLLIFHTAYKPPLSSTVHYRVDVSVEMVARAHRIPTT